MSTARILMVALAVWLGWFFVAFGFVWLVVRLHDWLTGTPAARPVAVPLRLSPEELERRAENRAREREFARLMASPFQPDPVNGPPPYDWRLEALWDLPAVEPPGRRVK